MASDVSRWRSALSFGAVTLAAGHRHGGPDHGTWVAEHPTHDAYWDQPGRHLPWVVVHTKGGKADYVPPTAPRQMLAHSLGLARHDVADHSPSGRSTTCARCRPSPSTPDQPRSGSNDQVSGKGVGEPMTSQGTE